MAISDEISHMTAATEKAKGIYDFVLSAMPDLI
jgi:hypothetical protein